MSNLFKITNFKYFRPFQTIIYQLRPNVSVFDHPCSDEIVYCDHDYIMIGGGPDGPAIMIDKDLKQGFSNENNCFKMPIFSSKSKGNFEVLKLEIYLLD